MADVFISYAHEDKNWASALAELMEKEGWSVFWDRRIPPGRDFLGGHPKPAINRHLKTGN